MVHDCSLHIEKAEAEDRELQVSSLLSAQLLSQKTPKLRYRKEERRQIQNSKG